MCECGEQYDDVITRLNAMDKARDESDVLPLVQGIAKDMKQLKDESTANHLFLFGNGDMTKSFVYRSEQYFKALDQHLKEDAERIEAEKKAEEERKDFLKDIAKPVIVEGAKYLIFGGGLLWLFGR